MVLCNFNLALFKVQFHCVFYYSHKNINYSHKKTCIIYFLHKFAPYLYKYSK